MNEVPLYVAVHVALLARRRIRSRGFINTLCHMRTHLCISTPTSVQGYLPHKKAALPTSLIIRQDHHRNLGIALLQGPKGGVFLMREVPLNCTGRDPFLNHSPRFNNQARIHVFNICSAHGLRIFAFHTPTRGHTHTPQTSCIGT